MVVIAASTVGTRSLPFVAPRARTLRRVRRSGTDASYAEDALEHREWIRHFKAHPLERFEQLEIYVASYPVDVH
jgi:hypothetical protein